MPCARALRSEAGSALVFLPGAAEIRRCETRLRERVDDPAVDIVPLFGALDAATQDRAIAPSPPGRRKVVLRDIHRRNVAHHRRRAHCG